MSALRKAGSLIVAKRIKDITRNNLFDYQLLYLKRTSKMKFADVLAYPGGVIEDGDFDYIKANHTKFPPNVDSDHLRAYHSAKIATLRETYEETGLFFLADTPKQDTIDIVKNILHYSRENRENPTFYECARALNMAYEDVHEVIRLVTVPQLPSRFDCQFFLHVASPEKTLNLFKAMEHIDHLHNFEELKFQKEESTGYTWLNPGELLNLNLEKKIKLAPPQLMLANIMLSFPKIDTFVEYLKEIKAKEENQKAKDRFERNPLTFPFMLGMSKITQPELLEKGYQVEARLQCDKDYPLENCLKLEKDGEWRKELTEAVNSIHEDNKGQCRVLFKEPKEMFEGEFDFEINTAVDFPYKYMVGKSAMKEKLSKLTTK